MKVLVALLALVALAYAYDDIDWSTVQPAYVRLPIYQELKEKYPSAFKNERIVGGWEVEPNSAPSQVALLLTAAQGTFFCGGTLISRRSVLTAAHCLDGVVLVQVILGAHSVQQVEDTQVRIFTSRFTQHAGWNANTLQNDIAVIDLDQEVSLTAAIQIIPLPRYSDVSNSFSGVGGLVRGWGLDSDSATAISPVLRQVAVDVITNLWCNVQFLGQIQNTHVCTSGSGGVGACSGDSGGPLVVGNMQIGTVSFGLAIGCEIGWPTVYTRLTLFLDWIAANSDVTIFP